MIVIYTILLYQRCDEDEKAKDPPIPFSAATPQECVSLLRRHVDDNFELQYNATGEAQRAYARAEDFDQMHQWFDRHYCYFDLSLHTAEIYQK